MVRASRILLSTCLWPLLFGGCLALTAFGLRDGTGVYWFNGVYLGLAICLGLLERVWPHDSAWLVHDNQVLPDFLHTLLTKGGVQVAVTIWALFGYASLLPEGGRGLWPVSLPLWMQVAVGLLVAEFGLYWAHRVAHEWPTLWRFHAVHHSVERLWFFNTGRFHFVDTAWSILLSQPLLLIAGASAEVIIWVGVVTAFVGMLTHCNVEMRTGWLDFVFNTPTLHRWHHSRDPREGNSNYGENLMVWDLVFGTFLRPRIPAPKALGIEEPMPVAFLDQLRYPFRRRA